MIKIHSTFLLNQTTHRLAWILVLLTYGLLYNISSLDVSMQALLYDVDMVVFEFRYQGMIILKIILVAWITFLWLYAEYYNNYDVYLLVRYPPVFVYFTKWLVLVVYTSFIGSLLLIGFISLWTLYPIDVTIAEAQTLVVKGMLFIIYYNAFCFVMSRLLQHISSVFIPIGFYAVGMVMVDINNGDFDRGNIANYITLIAPDVYYHNHQFFFLFGDTVVVIMIVICLQIVLRILIKRDIL